MMSRERGDDAVPVRGERPPATDGSAGTDAEERDTDDVTDPGTVTEPATRTDPANRTDPETVTETFTLLSNETRVKIVQALDDAGEGRALRFSELRAAVGVRDGGRFNYHLAKLCGRLVEKRDGGYVLTPEGERAAALV